MLLLAKLGSSPLDGVYDCEGTLAITVVVVVDVVSVARTKLVLLVLLLPVDGATMKATLLREG